jgi:hypothetical protein
VGEYIKIERGPCSHANTVEKLLGRNSNGSGLEIREHGLGIRHAVHVAASVRKSWYNFADKPRAFGQYSSLADSGHGVSFLYIITITR